VADVPRRAAELIAAQFDKLAAAAEGCDVLVASGLMPAVAGARSVAEKLGIRSVHVSYCPIFLPSPHHPPHPLPGRPFPPEVTDNGVLNGLDVQSYNALFGEALNTHRAAVGLPPVDDVRAHILSDHPWLAADPILAPWQEPADLDVVHTGAWILPDVRPLPAELEAFLDAGTPPVYVGFGSMRRAPEDIARVAAVVHHGGAGTTTTAARAGAPQVVVPQMADQPYWAARVAELGIGTAHDGPTPTTESPSAALRTTLTPETRARATAIAGTIRTDGATVAATLLLDAVSRERPPVSA
jgi:vancomycin aglycone glucosyltransferase